MPARYRHKTIKPADGGALINVASLENVGESNYCQKVNMRRNVDREVRREGWEYFKPGDSPDAPIAPGVILSRVAPLSALRSVIDWSYRVAPEGMPTDGWAPPESPEITAPITAIAQCVRADGTRALFAATSSDVFRYEPDSGTWTTIGSGYANGKRWEVVQVNGELVFNNGVDLPFSISVTNPTCRPIHELRERGVARVGTIAEYYGFLHCFDITEIQPDELNDWMNGATPYGVVPDAICNRIRQRHIWSEYGQPRNWAPAFKVTLSESGSIIQLPFPSQVFVANETRVAVVGGGINGGTLGGETGYEDGILVTAVAGAQISLEVATAAGITYPREVTVMRFADTSSIVGYNDMTDDGSAIVKALALRDVFVVYRETGVFVGRYTAVLEQPFLFKRIYNGLNVPYFPDTVIEVQGVGHLYAGADRFFLFDGIDEPKLFPTLDLARSRFYQSTSGQYSAFAVQQPKSREIWFCTPEYTIVYEYESKTASEIDTGITAAAMIVRPGSVDDLMFVLANVETYGVTVFRYVEQWVVDHYEIIAYQIISDYKFSVLAEYGSTYSRYGRAERNSGVLASGLWSLGDEFNEKTIRTYILQLASGQPSEGWSAMISLYGKDDASEPARLLFTATVWPPDFVNGRLALPVFFRATYFQDVIKVTGTADVQITGRTIEVVGDYTRGIERTRQ